MVVAMRSNSNSDRFRGFFGLIMVLIFHPAVVFMVLSCPFVVQGHPFCGWEDGGGAQGKFPVASDAMVSVFLWKTRRGVCMMLSFPSRMILYLYTRQSDPIGNYMRGS